MAAFRSWAVLLLVVLAVAQCTGNNQATPQQPSPNGRSTESRRKRDSSDYFEDTASTAAEEGLQGDAGENDGVQADDGDDGEEEEEGVISTPVMKSKPEHVVARPGQTVSFPCEIANSSDAVATWSHGEEKLYMMSSGGTPRMKESKVNLIRPSWSIEIPSVGAADAGEYTCSIMTTKDQQNQSVTHTLRLISAPVIVGMWPQNDGRRVVEGSDLRITCQAEGAPKPTISWSKTAGGTNKRVGAKEAHFEADSIVIGNVQRHHAGEYICMAENGVGNPILGSVIIQVLGKPRVHIHKALINAAVGVTAVIGCTVHDEPESRITWMKDDEELTGSADVVVTYDYPSSTVRIPAVKAKDFGKYTCHASNTYGSHNKSATLVEEPVIEELSVVGESLMWKVHSHMPLEKVELQYRRIDQPDAGWQKMSVKPQQTEHHVHTVLYPLSDLQAGEYEARSSARNGHGWSVMSDSLFFSRGVDEPNHENIQAAGVGANLGGGAPHLKSTAPLIATLFTCLLIRLI